MQARVGVRWRGVAVLGAWLLLAAGSLCGARAQTSCEADDHTLCFLGGQVSATAQWRSSADEPLRDASARELGNDTGAFWFFSEGNLEIVLKVLNGTSINQSIWVFLASLSDLEFTVRVQDHATGTVREYGNERGNRLGIVDIEAFRVTGRMEGETCGGLRPEGGGSCAPGLFCEDEPGECSIPVDGIGTCARIPAACTQEIDPVCGCDGATYTNDCQRQLAGVSKLHDGACEDEAQMCGGIAGLPCDPNEVCVYPEDMCQVADLAGVCQPGGGACPAVYEPVCGCDGQTYSNECELRNAGVPKLADGACGY